MEGCASYDHHLLDFCFVHMALHYTTVLLFFFFEGATVLLCLQLVCVYFGYVCHSYFQATPNIHYTIREKEIKHVYVSNAVKKKERK